MTALNAGQHVLIRDLAHVLTQAKVKAGAIQDTIDERNLVTAVLGIVESDLRLLAALVSAIAANEPVAKPQPQPQPFDLKAVATDIALAPVADLRVVQ